MAGLKKLKKYAVVYFFLPFKIQHLIADNIISKVILSYFPILTYQLSKINNLSYF